jgi:hypothetical protein
MNSATLINQFRFNQMTLSALLQDVSEEDSLASPTGGNCINFMLGHLIAARGTVLKNTGANPVWLAALSAPYARGENTYPVGAKSVSELKDLVKRSFEDLSTALAAFEPRLSETCTERMPHLDSGTWTDRFASFACHEAYHIGQIGLTRRALGKKGLF